MGVSGPQTKAAAIASSGSSEGTHSNSATNNERVGPCAPKGAVAKLQGGMRESCMCPTAPGSTPERKLSLSAGRSMVKKLFWWPDHPDGE